MLPRSRSNAVDPHRLSGRWPPPRFFFLAAVRLALAAIALIAVRAAAQGDLPPDRVGAAFGFGTQPSSPFFEDKSYRHEVTGYKILWNRPLTPRGSFRWELQVEPSFYLARQKLMNPYDAKPSDRARFTRGETVREYVVNPGFQCRYSPSGWFSLFFLASIGPAWIDKGSERLASGFAFSDILAGGLGLRLGSGLLELRPSLRHVSNLYTQKPNHGYNSGNLDVALSFDL